jgi:FkbM family methyltransferase
MYQMLIEPSVIQTILKLTKIPLTGVFHVGAHDCEEMSFYNGWGLTPDKIVWIDAIQSKVDQAKNRGIPNVYQAVVTDKDDDTVVFHESNNVQSSSVLNLKTHLQEHPWVHYVKSTPMQTVTVDTFFKRNNLDASNYTFWNIDIQGAELLALKGAEESLKFATALYLEVNEKELYENCALIEDIDTFLLQRGFSRAHTNMTRHGWGDALYIKSS